MTSVYDFSARAIDGTDVSLDRFRGQALLIVNTASKCGFTGQYDGLEKLHRAFADQPGEVLGFPCNQFGGQEPGNADEIAEFCKVNFGVTFPLMAKIDVNGAGRTRSMFGPANPGSCRSGWRGRRSIGSAAWSSASAPATPC